MNSYVVRLLVVPVLAAASPLFAADPAASAIIGAKIVVKDYQKAIDFYSKLGLKVGQKYNASELEMLSDNPQAPRLILIHDESGQMKRASGGSSLMMLVPDVKATAQTLKDAGYPGIGEPKTTARSVGLVVKDPDGDEVELLSPPPGR
jgi:predicted enzyme related to lactoylglutathione lyase